ncbi:hypothetical protein XM38_015150 [Halomicronema hongdechloris C2206]|uniref:Plasmid pRiA4b Orf3-like domain-containing protein n=1 Tax=Halomicronema hongdechloris C2206 TaxID=1641165 RepID=A0A1Z3HJW9_9CYAN|nr:plasmid pRiA4b ORF-3 family protein [Halomicronema hongdechloris]ASC70575.1 hypothetical protein XM38_015150 [Halomicronema hongdechloris C2206]
MTSHTLYRFRVELVDSDPPIWRRFQIPAQASLVQLHSVIQVVMGWSDSQPHCFVLPGAGDLQDEQLPLWQVLAHGSYRLLYWYAPQEGWLHRLILESYTRSNSPAPICLEGECACPPEGSGGIWGYEEVLERLDDNHDPAYLELWDRLGSDFDPDWFDLAAVNRRLQAIGRVS